MGQRWGAGQIDPEKCIHCLPISLTQAHCPTDDSARNVQTHDSPGVGAACPDYWEKIVEGRVGVPRVSWHTVLQEDGCGWRSTWLPGELGDSNMEDLIFGIRDLCV